MKINNNHTRHFNYLALLLIIVTFNPLVAKLKRAKRPYIYLLELNLRTGYHFYGESDSWLASKKNTIEKDIYFKGQSFFSANKSANDLTSNGGNVAFSMEILTGVLLENLPGLRKIKALHGFRGFRAGIGTTIYPFGSSQSYLSKGILTYTTPGASDPNLVTKNYNAELRIDETLFNIVIHPAFYYYHEKGIPALKKWGRIIPYVGIETGFAFVNGKRKYTLTSQPLSINTVANGTKNYSVDAAIQDTFFNQLAIRLTPVIGAQYHIKEFHHFDLRLGLVLQNSSLDMQTTGTFNEKATNPANANDFLYAYSQKVNQEKRSADYSNTGFIIMLGYTIGLK